MRLGFNTDQSRPLEFLCLGAHSDDIEIGCGGTILRLADEYPDARFHWVVLGARGAREDEARRAADLMVGNRLKTIHVHGFQDGFLPYLGKEVKDLFEDKLKAISPDLIFTHFRDDAHQDHRLICELTWNTFRDHLILEYEIPKYDGDFGRPNFYVPLSAASYRKKIDVLMEAFQTQRSKRWFDESTFLGLMRLRGVECNAPSGYAEAFYSRKAVL
ncbi:MAG: PIG-L deacetylase family protein [Terracidiphilus sp.]